MRDREKKRWGDKVKTKKFVAIFLAFILAPAILYAAVSLTAPTGAGIRDTFHLRETHPVTGKKSSPHRGTDYGVACGTSFAPRDGGKLSCITQSGYGGVGNVYHECGVMEKYAHLQGCNEGSQSMTSGGAKGMQGAGTSTGCHLHYEIRINDTAVDPTMAYGKDLCDPQVQKDLIADAQEKLNGLAGGGGGSGSGGQSPAEPPNDSTTSVEYVPTGGIDPTTHIPNTGGGYYVVTDVDGRTHTVVDLGNEDTELPALPPGTPPDLTPTADTDSEITGCATDTWKAMVNQSVLQTRREMVANQLYVTKPDSVMAYSCLADHMKLVGEKAGPIFSESKRWVNVEVPLINGDKVNVNKELGEYSLDGAVVNVALEPYEGYMRGFFRHDFLGGMQGGGAPVSGDGGEEDDVDQSYTPCGAMAKIWQMAKCANVDDNMKFYTFAELVSNDPRKFPKGYECNYTGITQAQIDTAKGKEVKYDKVNSYVDLIYPTNGACAPAVKTGVTVVRRERGAAAAPVNCPPGVDCGQPAPDDAERISQEKTYPDAVCLTNGCSYQADGNGGGTCVVK